MSEPAAPRAHDPSRPLANKYRLVRTLGQGGMGTVWEARHLELQRRFAIKFLLPELAASAMARTRFEREAKTAAAIESEHVVAVLDFGVSDEGHPFIVMEYLEGEDLAAVLERDGQLAVPRVVELVRQVARGLDRAHAQGVVHRDLKPRNLFLTRREDGSELVKVLDFGVAKLAKRDSGVSTKQGAVVGTLDYMPPEQLRGDPGIDERADVYSLGAVTYECLAGRRPYESEAPHALMYSILEAKLTPLETLRPGLPPALTEAVHRALNQIAQQRFSSAAAFATALSRACAPRERPDAVSATAATLADEDASLPAASEAGAPARAVVAAPSGRALRRSLLVLALPVLALGAGALAMRRERTGDSARPPTATPRGSLATIPSPNPSAARFARPESAPGVAAAPPLREAVAPSPTAGPSAPTTRAATSAQARSRASSLATARPSASVAAPHAKFDLDSSPYE